MVGRAAARASARGAPFGASTSQSARKVAGSSQRPLQPVHRCAEIGPMDLGAEVDAAARTGEGPSLGRHPAIVPGGAQVHNSRRPQGVTPQLRRKRASSPLAHAPHELRSQVPAHLPLLRPVPLATTEPPPRQKWNSTIATTPTRPCLQRPPRDPAQPRRPPPPDLLSGCQQPDPPIPRSGWERGIGLMAPCTSRECRSRAAGPGAAVSRSYARDS